MLQGRKYKVFVSFCLLALLVFVTGCSNDKMDEDNLTLAGESESWELDSYKVSVTPETMKAGNGDLTMKNSTEYVTDYINMEVHMVVNQQDKVIQEKQVSGETDISQTSTGTIEGGAFFQKDENFVEREAIGEIYMIIEWQDRKTDEKRTERIDLLDKENSFNEK